MNPDLFDRADGVKRRRAVLVLGGIAVLIATLLLGLVVFLLGLGTDPGGENTGQPRPRSVGAPPDGGSDTAAGGNWDVQAQTELATQPMLELPESAALPHALTDEVAGPPLTLPEASVTAGRVVASGFPRTEEGAVAQLVELTRVGLEGGDPDGYWRAYEAVAAPGAPPAESTFLYRDLEGVRSGVLPRSGAVAGLTFTWTPTSALVKGSTDGGRYVVACVLGELVAGLNGQSVSAGAGDCQAMRYENGEWRISPGAAAARATLAWPGTQEAVNAGYRDLR